MEFDDRIPKLIAGYLRNNLSPGEQKELDDWINEKDANRIFFEEAINEESLMEDLKDFNKEDKSFILDNTLLHVYPEHKTINKGRLLPMKRFMIAASVIIIAGAALFVLTRGSDKEESKTTGTTNQYKNDVPPGTDKAKLTLANGSTILLDNSENKEIADQNGTIINQQGTQLVYDASQSSTINPSTLSYNLLATERGGQFRLVLPDGSRVWLNAVSSIRYPTAFAGKERLVEITGEVYFEVRHDPAMPFKVRINGPSGNGGEVEVLGTKFNVNAYGDEALLNTTLLEGRVKVSKNSNAVVVKPGQQVQLTKQDQLKLIENADIDAAVAWKDGMFSFNASSIHAVMQQISRWYDVEVVYAGDVKETFFLKMSRNTNVSNVFKILETTGGVHFDIDGKKITVRP